MGRVLNDLDDEGNMLDSVSWEVVTPETGIVIGDRYYNRDTVIGILESDNLKDPYNTENSIEYLVENREDRSLKIKNDNMLFIYTYFILLLIFFIYMMLFYSVISEMSFSEPNNINSTESKVIGFLLLVQFALVMVFIFYPSEWLIYTTLLIGILIIIYFSVTRQHHFT